MAKYYHSTDGMLLILIDHHAIPMTQHCIAGTLIFKHPASTAELNTVGRCYNNWSKDCFIELPEREQYLLNNLIGSFIPQ